MQAGSAPGLKISNVRPAVFRQSGSDRGGCFEGAIADGLTALDDPGLPRLVALDTGGMISIKLAILSSMIVPLLPRRETLTR